MMRLCCVVFVESTGDCRIYLYCFFFFKQRTAYELRMSDWSSDVCSSDLIDDAIHDLLMRRTELARQIGRAKGQGAVFMRPGREARVLRRLVARHTGPFPKPVVTRIWREIISVFTRLQGPFAAAAYAPQQRPDLGSLARDHFGSLTPITRFESEMGVLRAVSSGKIGRAH